MIFTSTQYIHCVVTRVVLAIVEMVEVIVCLRVSLEGRPSS